MIEAINYSFDGCVSCEIFQKYLKGLAFEYKKFLTIHYINNPKNIQYFPYTKFYRDGKYYPEFDLVGGNIGDFMNIINILKNNY